MNTLLKNLMPHFLLVGYLGPETLMPLASILAAALGFILLVWRFFLKFIKQTWKRLYHKITRTPMEEPLENVILDDEGIELKSEKP